jgi:hypothetical protein
MLCNSSLSKKMAIKSEQCRRDCGLACVNFLASKERSEEAGGN